MACPLLAAGRAPACIPRPISAPISHISVGDLMAGPLLAGASRPLSHHRRWAEKVRMWEMPGDGKAGT